MSRSKGGFTLPGEAGYEEFTLKMAEKWGADVIRDSDGTELSQEIIDAGYSIYSTVCVVRGHNAWAGDNMDKLQQTFLMTQPVAAFGDTVTIDLMRDFFGEQFAVNSSLESMAYWQIYDRTSDTEVPVSDWSYEPESESITVTGCVSGHTYTASFLAYRIWEEISMYNHVTNHWDKEHLMPVDPRYEEAQEYLLGWMERWCREHPHTTVVRFTSLFYNFVWIWGSSERNRNLFTDWGSYDFTVSPEALRQFEKEYGYALTAEDFINQGKLQVTHMPASEAKKDWMEFTNRFVISFAKKLVDIVHRYGKKAYVFYDDSWIGLEPYKDSFREFGFDGLIKCVFSGFEARLCAGVDVPVHELRLHPYLFPVGLGGSPTFKEGGDPAADARRYWINVRRALLRAPVERIGLGGYLHLAEAFPEFQDYIEEIADEFRQIRSYHSCSRPYTLSPRTAVLHYWGRLRSWTLSGHFHETYMHDLIHINEALSGLPLSVSFIDFEDVKNGALDNYDVVINAGEAKTAWSGGDAWKDVQVVEKLTAWAAAGGLFIGIAQPSAEDGFNRYFRMADVLGVDGNIMAKVCHGKWMFRIEPDAELVPGKASVPLHASASLTDGTARVLAADGGDVKLAVHPFGKGMGIYMSGFEYSLPNARLLLNLILYGTGTEDKTCLTDNEYTECAYYPSAEKLVVINNSDREQTTSVKTDHGVKTFTLEPYALVSSDV